MNRKWLGIGMGAAAFLLVMGGIVAGAVLYEKKQPPKSRFEFEDSYAQVNASLPEMDKLRQILSSPEKETWLVSGDSIAQGCMHTGYQANYQEYLADYIGSIPGREKDLVLNTGVSSGTTTDCLRYFDTWIGDKNPSVVFMLLGMNDCATEGMTPGQYGENMREIVKKIRALDAVPVWMTPNTSQRQKEITPYLAQVRTVCGEEQVLLVDCNADWINHKRDVKKLMADGIHPNQYGHYRMTRFLLFSLGLDTQSHLFEKVTYTDLKKTLVKVDPAETAGTVSAAQKEAFQPLFANKKPENFLFTGGALSRGLELPACARNYMEHFQEVARWEMSGGEIVDRMKFMVPAFQDGYTVAQMSADFAQWNSQLHPAAVFILPEFRNRKGEFVESGLEDFRSQLLAYVRTVKASSAQVVLQTPPCFQSDEEAYCQVIREIAEQETVPLADHAKAVKQSGLTAEDRETIQLFMAKNLLQLAQSLPQNSRVDSLLRQGK